MLLITTFSLALTYSKAFICKKEVFGTNGGISMMSLPRKKSGSLGHHRVEFAWKEFYDFGLNLRDSLSWQVRNDAI